MRLKNYNIYFFFTVLVAVTVLAGLILKPFLIPFILAAVLAHLFNFIYRGILRVVRHKSISSLLTCFLVALIILIPLIFVSSLVVEEVQSMLARFSSESAVVFVDNLKNGIASVPFIKTFGVEKFINGNIILSALQTVSQNALLILEKTYSGAAYFMFVTIIMFFSLFYIFIDGQKFVKKIMLLSPIRDEYEKTLIERFNSISRATIKGTILVAIIQGIIGSILFKLTGVSSPIILGVLMTLTSVIPAIGSGLVWIPAGIVMILLGYTAQGIIIFAVGILVISMIDNIVKPHLVGKDTQMHPLMVLFATLGGLALFGISGFIVGPIIMALFVALWEIYYLEFKHQLKDFNK